MVPDVTLGKRSALLELRAAPDRATFEALLGSADIIVHGYRAGALERLGFDAAARRRLAPGVIDVRLNAYGWNGPWAGAEKPLPLPVPGARSRDRIPAGRARDPRRDSPLIRRNGHDRARLTGPHGTAAAARRRRDRSRPGGQGRPRAGDRNHAVGSGAAGPSAAGRRRGTAALGVTGLRAALRRTGVARPEGIEPPSSSLEDSCLIH